MRPHRFTPAEPISLLSADIQWQVLPGWQEVLLGSEGLRLAEWLEQGRAAVVKDGIHRTVYRVDVAHRSFFVKHYRARALVKAGRNLWRASASRREYHRAVEVGRRSIPTVVPVAVGERRRHGLVHENFLVTEAVPRACSLEEYVAEHLPALPLAVQAAVRRRLIRALARLCAAAHRAGVVHDDLHPGNILVRIDGWHAQPGRRGLPQMHLIDLPGIRLGGPLTWADARASLAMLGATWVGRATAREWWRFWKCYLAERPELRVGDARLAAFDLARRSWRRAQRIARRRDRRSLRVNREFYRVRSHSAVAHAVAGLSPGKMRRLLADPERLLRANHDHPHKLTHRSVVVRAQLEVCGRPVAIAYKRTRVRNWFKALLAPWRRSRSIDAWKLGHALLARGIATARPLLVCQPRGWPLRWDSYLATEWIEGAENLHLYGWKLAGYAPAERRRRTRQAAASLGRLLGRMHAWQVGHPDLKGCNLVLAERADAVEAYLIDLDGVRLARRLSADARARQLARLAASLEAHRWLTRADRLRFLRAYVRELPAGGGDWKQLWRDIAWHARGVIGRLRRRGRAVV